jgi:hypothetical protein
MLLFLNLALSQRLARRLSILAFSLLLSVATSASAQAPWEKYRGLSEREKTFLKTVFEGNEAKAREYVQVAGINVNALAGEPLSVWFYRMAGDAGRPPFVRDTNVQRIVFEAFRQNVNPANIGENYLERFCQYAPYPSRGGMASQAEIQAAQKPYADAMVAGFQSLLKYGLRDRALINAIFQGCIFKGNVSVTESFYQAVLSPMIKAGADVNAGSPQRPIERAVETLTPDLAEGLVRDRAQVNLTFNVCQRPSNLYGYLFRYLGYPQNREKLVRMARALHTGGLLVTAKTGWIDTGGYGQCHFGSFYDAVVDKGDVELAKQLKEIASSAPAVALPPAAPAPSTSQPVGAPLQMGAWKIATENGKTFAMAKAEKSDGGQVAGIRLECAAPGKLEYVPVASRATIKTLWVNGMDDIQHTIPLAAGRVSGADNSMLSMEFLGSEANYKRNGTADWGIEMSVDGPEAAMQTIKMSGFSQMRGYMLANCKKQG